jgi:hypothetical protein
LNLPQVNSVCQMFFFLLLSSKFCFWKWLSHCKHQVTEFFNIIWCDRISIFLMRIFYLA